MEKQTFTNSRRLAIFFAVAVFITASLTALDSFKSSAQKMDEDYTMLMMAGTMSGRVFHDYNQNGTYDTVAGVNSIDSGVAGVTVSAYDPAGALQGSAVTAADGTYSFLAGGNGPYRVEFTTLPAGYTPSARSTDSVLGGAATNAGSTVQFVNNVATADINLAVTRAEEYCQNNPTLVVPRYAQGASNGGYANNPVLFDFPYNSGTVYTDPTEANYDNPTAHLLSVDIDELGTINSLAYDRIANRLYAASYFKRHAGFGPGADGILNNADDPAAIYVVNPTGAGSVVSVLSVPGVTTNSHNVNDYDTDNGNTGWNGTGKTSLGGMALADDNSKLFVMNLQTRSLAAYTFATSSWATSANMDGLTMNTPGGTAAQCATGGDRRPFAVKFYRGSVYIGVVCTAQSTANVNNLFAYVFSVDPATLAINPTPVHTLDLDYPRGVGNPGLGAEWQPWTATIQSNPGGGIWVYPQPWLTDIDFDRGNLIMGLRDRTGDSDLDLTFRTAGDVIRACGNFGAWTNESNGRCGTPATGTAPQNTGQGPGNGEFYHQDDFCTAPNNGQYHDEVLWGAVMQLPGRQGVVATLLDPINRQIANGATFDGGFRWMNNTSGSSDRAYRLYNGNGGAGDPDFGKTNGLGDIAALCSAAPIEIGNRVWRDTNGNGVQDPGEPGIAGVTVRLYAGSSGTVLATAVTDANGEYYFVNGTSTVANVGQVTGGIQFNTAYQIRLDNATNYLLGQPLYNMPLTVLNQTSQNGDDDSSDSDASRINSGSGFYPTISLTTGGPGANNHTYDFGFTASVTSAGVSVEGRITLQAGNGIRNVRVYLTETDGTVHAATTGAFGYYRFDDVEAGQNVVVSVQAKRYTFTPAVRLVALGDSAAEVNWIANE